MSEKRRDNRNRILHVGESQRPDGRYAYKYKDLNGDYKFVYSWRLDKNETPKITVEANVPVEIEIIWGDEEHKQSMVIRK